MQEAGLKQQDQYNRLSTQTAGPYTTHSSSVSLMSAYGVVDPVYDLAGPRSDRHLAHSDTAFRQCWGRRIPTLNVTIRASRVSLEA